ncbi:MAG: isoleucine--tRNA ligase [Candidatus Shikimatogenerans bostrichidophilus]|nr:MAG: isoleucine--tRNA ligase [Candidatus Shikimatogenerans bostrichidophilus]
MNNKLELYKIYKKIFNYWKKNYLINFKKKNKKKFIIYDGPPSMNGNPGIHHIFSRIIKDIVYRFYTLNNYEVINKLGWDTHGLPIELYIEKKLKINKSDIGKSISIKKFNKYCKKFINKNLNFWIKFTNKIGYFIKDNKYYITCNSKYIESVWWIIKQIFNKKLLYKDYKVLPYSPIAGTSISYQELNLPNTKKKITIYSIYILFKLKTKPYFFNKIKNTIHILVWTTTPWTLPSNTALLIKDNIYYLLIKYNNLYIITSKKSVKFLFNKLNTIKILYKFKGEKIINCEYYQLLKWFKPLNNNKKKFIIIKDTLNIIKENKGSGIIHIAPTFGKDDYEISIKENISSIFYKYKKKIIPIVDKYGKYIKVVPYGLGGKYVKNSYYNNKNKFSVDKKIIKILKNKILIIKKYKHKYPHCWRTNKPIIYYPIESWFINLTKKNIKNRILNLSKKINWITNTLIKNKFIDWLNNIKDWNITRTRYWGTPLPIWSTKDNKSLLVIGSIKELYNEINKSIKLGYMKKNPFKKWINKNFINYNKINLHKDILDKIILSNKNGKKMYRESYVLDVWFDSGSSTYAQYHYPFKNSNLIDNKIYYPSNFISEGTDQIRGWFFTLHIISSIISNNISYKNVLPLGLILDKNGHKMSKSKGNTLNPFKLIYEYGPDCIRWYLIFNNNHNKNIKFNIKDLKKIKNKFFNTLYNIFIFIYNYSNIDKYNYNYLKKIKNKIVFNYIDKWIISKLNNLLLKINKYFKIFNFTKISRLINIFIVKDLSNWYIRLSRNRFWKNTKDNDKKSAYLTLFICLKKILIVSYPIIPFITEYIYLKLYKDKISIIYNNIPKGICKLINRKIEYNMYIIRKYTKIILSLRKRKNIKVRQPLSSIYIVINKYNKELSKLIKPLEIIKKEVNVKKISFINIKNINKYILKKIKLNYSIVGPKYKSLVNKISIYLNNLNQKEIYKIIKNKYIYIKQLNIKLNNKDYYILNQNINNKDNLIYIKNNTIIILNTIITDKLKNEGWIRDFIRNIQFIRKNKNFKITDKIYILLYKKSYLIVKNIIKKYNYFIKNETLAKKIIIINYKPNNNIYYNSKFIYYDINLI